MRKLQWLQKKFRKKIRRQFDIWMAFPAEPIDSWMSYSGIWCEFPAISKYKRTKALCRVAFISFILSYGRSTKDTQSTGNRINFHKKVIFCKKFLWIYHTIIHSAANTQYKPEMKTTRLRFRMNSAGKIYKEG